MREYDQIADWYTATRSSEVGVPDLAAFAQRLAPRARVLDLGCGDGVPLSQYLIRHGFDVVGLDSSPEMIARFRATFPTLPGLCGRAEDAHFAPGSFEAVVAWGVLFHLPRAEQGAVIRKVSDWLTPGGRFLFSSGEAAGVREGDMNGVTFRYVSLGATRYRRLLDQAGLVLETHASDAWENHVYVARKAAASGAEE